MMWFYFILYEMVAIKRLAFYKKREYFERKGAGLTEEIIGHLELFNSEENLEVAK